MPACLDDNRVVHVPIVGVSSGRFMRGKISVDAQYEIGMSRKISETMCREYHRLVPSQLSKS